MSLLPDQSGPGDPARPTAIPTAIPPAVIPSIPPAEPSLTRVLDLLDGLEELPVAGHVAAYEQALTALRAALSLQPAGAQVRPD